MDKYEHMHEHECTGIHIHIGIWPKWICIHTSEWEYKIGVHYKADHIRKISAHFPDTIKGKNVKVTK